ncbi:MAG: antiviral reverse transcriptase Drt3a [Hyphomicrobium sp.]|jgi:hypothetical protein
MFTAENFRHIFDLENRKGNDLATRFFPDLERYTLAVKDKARELRELRASKDSLPVELFQISVDSLRAQLKALKSNKSAAIDEELEKVSANVIAPNFKIDLKSKLGPNGKTVYVIDGSAETFFAIKQLQSNLHKLYGVKQSNRHDQVSRVRDTISGNYPYELVRTDIADFYESIDRKALVDQLETDQLLSASSKKYLRQVLDAYGKLAGTPTGIPRGVGISAYLAEFYIRHVDRDIKRIPGIVLYCRYVDDIVAIFARPPVGLIPVSYERSISDIFAQYSLRCNARKTTSFDFSNPGAIKFEYLGYRFLKGQKLEISPSSKKIRKYKMRLNAAFDHYAKLRHLRPRRSFRDLVARIKFLTGNTRLVNSKASAVTGIYYSNSAANEISSFVLLDKILTRRLGDLKSGRLKKRLKPYRFKKGFEERRFHHFSTKELKMIVEAWQHG